MKTTVIIAATLLLGTAALAAEQPTPNSATPKKDVRLYTAVNECRGELKDMPECKIIEQLWQAEGGDAALQQRREQGNQMRLDQMRAMIKDIVRSATTGGR
jgi:hypothetical protein